MTKKLRYAICGGALLLFAVGIGLFATLRTPTQTIVIAVSEEQMPLNENTNDYLNHLEEVFDVDITFQAIPSDYDADYLTTALESGSISADIFFDIQCSSGSYFTSAQIATLGEQGILLPLDAYITTDSYYTQVVAEFTDYDLDAALRSADGCLYYYPSLDASIYARSANTLWINSSWLAACGETLPTTVDGFFAMLASFYATDVNQNGMADEIPIAACLGDTSIYDYLLNAFVPTNAQQHWFYLADGVVQFAPTGEGEAFRQAVICMNTFYALTEPYHWALELTQTQMTELASNPNSTVGCFVSASLSDVVLAVCDDMIAKYDYTLPLTSAYGAGYPLLQIPSPSMGAVINANTAHPALCAALLDYMLSEEAYLMAQYGQEGDAWHSTDSIALDGYGEVASIEIVYSLTDIPQNQTLQGVGPSYIYPQYANYVVWQDTYLYQLSARAYQNYASYNPTDTRLAACFVGEGDTQRYDALDAYTEAWLTAFITGAQSATDDDAWAAFVAGYDDFAIDTLLATLAAELY